MLIRAPCCALLRHVFSSFPPSLSMFFFFLSFQFGKQFSLKSCWGSFCMIIWWVSLVSSLNFCKFWKASRLDLHNLQPVTGERWIWLLGSAWHQACRGPNFFSVEIFYSIHLQYMGVGFQHQSCQDSCFFCCKSLLGQGSFLGSTQGLVNCWLMQNKVSNNQQTKTDSWPSPKLT